MLFIKTPRLSRFDHLLNVATLSELNKGPVNILILFMEKTTEVFYNELIAILSRSITVRGSRPAGERRAVRLSQRAIR